MDKDKQEVPQDLEKAKSLLQDEERKNKLLKLMGGGKAKNQPQAKKWLSRNRTEEEEKELKANMQSHFQRCHEKKTNGDTRRRQGLGFSHPKLDNEESLEPQRVSAEKRSSITSESKTERQRSRSRSPIRGSNNTRERMEKEPKAANNNDITTTKSPYDNLKKDKKSFYSQFKKSSG